MTKVTKTKATAVLLATVVVAVMMTACEHEGGLLGKIEAEPTCSTGSLEFIEVEGAAAGTPQQITLGNRGDQPADFTLQDDANWLDISPDSVTSDGPGDDVTVDVTPELAGLLPGVYTATIWVRCGEWQQAVAVELVVVPYDPVGDNIIYVSIDGDDALGNGTIANPYRTVTKGVSMLVIIAGKDTVYILPSDTAYAAGETFPIQLDVLAAPATVAVTAAGAEYVEISGGNLSRVFEVSSGETCTLSGLTVSDGSSSSSAPPKHGAGVYVSNGTITIADCVFQNCSADDNGGAVRVDGGSVASFSGCVFRLNDAGGDGGAVSDGSGPTFDDCVFEGNTAAGAGGGVGGAGGAFTRCVFSGNSAVGSGGGCFLGGAATVQDCTFDLNSTGLDGGAIYAAGGKLTIDGSIIFSNLATGAGGGVYVSGGGSINSSVVASNTADAGGGIYVTSAGVTITRNTVVGNVANTSGGGIYDSASSPISDSTIDSNTADEGGGIYVASAPASVSSVNVVNNYANASGGGIYISAGGGVSDSTFDANTADVGGGIYVTLVAAFIGVNTITGNHANTSGGGVAFDAAGAGAGLPSSMFHDCRLRDNTADVSGGGIFVTGASLVACGPNAIVSNSAPTGGGVHIAHGSLGGQPFLFFRTNLVALNQGGGVLLELGTLDVESCTIVDNEGVGLWDSSIAMTGILVVNSIFWGNDDDIDGVVSSEISYCYISDGDYSGANNNIDVTADPDPLFVDPSGEDYHLQLGSPCIDAGDNSADLWPVDLDGNPRVVDGDGDFEPWNGTTDSVDMGCYEYQ